MAPEMTGTIEASTAPLHEGLELLERAIGYTRLSLRHVTPEMLCLPTPCGSWRLGALLDHMEESLETLTEAADLQPVAAADPPGPPSPVDAVERLRLRACSLLGSWARAAQHTADDTPDNAADDWSTASAVLAAAGALEVAVHGWDVSQAAGLREPVPAALARDLLPWAGVLVTDADRPERFDHPLAGPTVGPSSRLLRLLGREP